MNSLSSSENTSLGRCLAGCSGETLSLPHMQLAREHDTSFAAILHPRDATENCKV